MNWLNSFELMCYIIVALLLVHLVRHKDFNSLFTFGAAALVGFFMELAAVAVTDIYNYNQGFWLNLGSEPKQFPLFGGLMWGGLTVCGIKLAQKLNFGKIMSALAAGMFIVTMDILLDVVAIRLDGGFWTWVGNPINTEITQSAFLSVIWVNFLGYMIETPTVVLLTQIKCKKVGPRQFGKQTLGMVLIALVAIIVTAVGSLTALGLNMLTNDWFACVVFILLWIFMAVAITTQAFRQRLLPTQPKNWDLSLILFWLAMYVYCLLATINLGLANDMLWFFIIGIVFMISTVYVAISEPKKIFH